MSFAKAKSLLSSIVEQMLLEKNIEDFKVYIDGGTGHGDGYMGDILFFHVIINNNERLNFVLKAGKNHEKLKTFVGSDIMCGRELDMYTRVLPTLEDFTNQRKSIELSKFIPKLWYGDKKLDQVNIVLENLKFQNFHIRDRRKPMDFPHMKILFETFGKWHGISMAFKDQHPEKWFEMVGSWSDPRAKFQKSFCYEKQFKKELKIIQKLLIEHGRSDLAIVYEGVEDQIRRVLCMKHVDAKDLVIISHGDNWSTNYMFKYGTDNNGNSAPNQVCFIDFQLSRLDTPAFELGSSLYNMGDKQTFDKFDDLLSIYHESLSMTLTSLGSNPNEVFTMDDLKMHWRKYSLSSVLFVFVYIRIALCDPTEAPDLAKIAENGANFDGAFGFRMKNMDTFWKRALDVFVHYGELLQKFSSD